MTTTLQKTGGIAAMIEAMAYILGFAVMLTILRPDNADSLSGLERLKFALDNQSVIFTWNLFIYVFFGAVLVILSLALHERLAKRAPATARVATAFGLIWAGLVIAAGMIANTGLAAAAKLYAIDPLQAVALWHSVTTIQEGVGGGVELVGGVWCILVSCAALSQQAFPRALNCLGIAVGAAGVLTVIPALKELGALFGLGQIVWFSWLGLVMVRSPAAEAAGD